MSNHDTDSRVWRVLDWRPNRLVVERHFIFLFCDLRIKKLCSEFGQSCVALGFFVQCFYLLN